MSEAVTVPCLIEAARQVEGDAIFPAYLESESGAEFMEMPFKPNDDSK